MKQNIYGQEPLSEEEVENLLRQRYAQILLSYPDIRLTSVDFWTDMYLSGDMSGDTHLASNAFIYARFQAQFSENAHNEPDLFTDAILQEPCSVTQ